MTAPARLLTRFRGLPAAITLVVASAALVVSALSPLAARADALDDYAAANDQLEALLTERDSLETSIATAVAAERAALVKLGDAEGTLARLVAERRTNETRRSTAAGRLADAEAQVPSLDQQAAQLERRIDAQERWLLDGEAPRATSSPVTATRRSRRSPRSAPSRRWRCRSSGG